LEVWQGGEETFVSEEKYANEILKKFHMEKRKPKKTSLIGNWRKEDATSCEIIEATIYKYILGSLMYLVNTRPNKCYAINQICQGMVSPTRMYWNAIKHVLRYLRGTTQFGLWYKQIEGAKLQGFTNTNWTGIQLDRKSTLGGIFSVESTTISWYNKKHISIALRSVEVEYMVAIQATCEAI